MHRVIAAACLVLLLGASTSAEPTTAPATTTASSPTLRPFTAFAWTPPQGRFAHVVPMVPFSPGTAPWAVARAAADLPADERVLLMLELPKLIWNHRDDQLSGAGGKKYQGPWLEGGSAAAADWFTKFLSAFQFARGSMVFLAQDSELDLSMWSAKQPQIDAIAADPRWKKAAPQVGDVSKATDLSTWPLGARYNTAVGAILAGYVRRAISDPLHRAFPEAGTSEFGNAILPPSLATRAPDLNGCVQPVDEPLYGTAESPGFYANPNNLAHQGRVDFAGSPLPTLIWQTGNARAYRLASARPILPWIPAKGWKESRLAGTPYYDELLRHVLLCSESTNVLFWNTTTHLQFDDDNATMDRLLGDFATQLRGRTDLHCLTPGPVSYDAPLLISGVRTGDGRRVFRVTLSPHQQTATLTLPGETTPTLVRVEPGEVGAWIVRP